MSRVRSYIEYITASKEELWYYSTMVITVTINLLLFYFSSAYTEAHYVVWDVDTR